MQAGLIQARRARFVPTLPTTRSVGDARWGTW